MADRQPPSVWSRRLAVLLRYGAWLALSALGLWIALQFHINVLDLLIVFRVRHWSIPAIEKSATVVLVLIWLSGVLGLEHYFASAQEQRVFWRRVSRVAVIEAGVLAFSYILQWII